MFQIETLYFGESPKRKYDITYDPSHKKRPSWIRFSKLPKNLSFLKITKNEESFWYRLYFEHYFFPLMPTPIDYKNYYDKIAGDYESFVPHNKKIGKFIASMLDKYEVKKNAKILEVCAGTGLISKQIVNEGYSHYTLLDISNKCLTIAKKKKKLKSCKFINKDLLTFATKEKFDVIINSLGLDLDYFNYRELEKIFGNFQHILKKKGLFISVDRHIYSVYDSFFTKLEASHFFLHTTKRKEKYVYFIGKPNHTKVP